VHQSTRLWTVFALSGALLGSGCATKKYVQGEVGSLRDQTDEHIKVLQSQVEHTQTDLAKTQGDLAAQGQVVKQVSKTAQEALERAVAAGKLAEGRFLFETVLTDDKVRFALNDAALSEEAKSALNEFAGQLKQSNENVFIEIQGHTDSSGSEATNMRLGEARAEAARRYLNASAGIALHRMSVISYGESAPMSDNGTRDGRRQNRRVALVVLK